MLFYIVAKKQKRKGPKQSSFESELTNVGRKSVKGLRYKYVDLLYIVYSLNSV